MSSKLITFALVLTFSSFSVHTKMFKCTDNMGNVSYSDSSCKDENAKEKSIVVKENSAKAVNETGEVGLMPGVPMGPHIPDMEGARMGSIGYGINSNHPQLKGLVIGEKDFTGEGIQPSQNRDTIEALISIKTFMSTATGDGADTSRKRSLPLLVSAKVIGKKAVSNQEIAERMVKAIQWLSETHASNTAISMPLPGGDNDYTALCKEMERSGILFIVSMSDLRKGSIGYPPVCKPSVMLVVGINQ
jgi:hypothetical protein